MKNVGTRNVRLEKLRAQDWSRQLMFSELSEEKQATVCASDALSELIAKRSNLFVENDFDRECLIEIAGNAISSSQNIVVEIYLAIIFYQMKIKPSNFEAFSIASDRNMSIRGIDQLTPFLRANDTDFNNFPELLEPMHDATKTQYVFIYVYKLLQKYK
ncbi:hypothetical protein HNY73_006087 [Argiope bruennichi]|uniref:Uncharacterized protein n=1 Tax=Argiope bruennichi TaxID=94029 RepID=A0A8T0FJI6_ARGBR|nr:hypothetical protein HNY73_006087 [Argiope bruennichi]